MFQNNCFKIKYNTDQKGINRYYLFDFKGHVHSQYVEFEAGHISVQLIKGQIARSEVSISFLLLM